MSKKIKFYLNRYFVQGMSAMALGLFSSLIIGLIMSQLAKVPVLAFLGPFSEIISASSPVVGGAIGASIAVGLKEKPLVVFSCVAAGAYGYQMGGPVGAWNHVLHLLQCPFKAISKRRTSHEQI